MTQVERMLPLYEAKMMHQYDHRWATYGASGTVRDVAISEKEDPEFRSVPRYWVRASVVRERLADRWDAEWLLGWRDICRSTDERTTIASIVGEGASPEGGTLLAMPAEERSAAVLLCIWNSFAFDFCARQKVGGTHLKYFTMRQLPTLPGPLLETPTPWAPEQSLESWLVVRAAALSVSATDMAALADSLDASVAPLWRPKRHLIRAELDACMFHLFGVARDDVDYVLETFPIVKRKDIAAHGEYRTKRLILETYDAMVEAIETGVPYESPFDDLLTEGE